MNTTKRKYTDTFVNKCPQINGRINKVRKENKRYLFISATTINTTVVRVNDTNMWTTTKLTCDNY